MGHKKSLDEFNEVEFIAHVLDDVRRLHSEVYTPREARLDYRKVKDRVSREGISFLTKALPRLGKALDVALSGDLPLDCTGFRKIPGTQIPKFLGKLFEKVFAPDGRVLPMPCAGCIASLREVLYLFYKYELPYSKTDEQKVIDQFVKTDQELSEVSDRLRQYAFSADAGIPISRSLNDPVLGTVIVKARERLSRVFRDFDPADIVPSHGPGAVSTRERYGDKYEFRTISARITDRYPVDAYFFASVGHLCDRYHDVQSLAVDENFARVVLVPKDSRGPRLISCEPLEFQWIQQGLSRAIVDHVESHPATRWYVHFTDQRPNQIGALHGSKTGRYATLDLKEASDRVSVGLVHLLFPAHLWASLEACRTLATVLPNGSIHVLNKFAPMGSALCFPVMALTIWAILSAGAPDADTEDGILVYGDDVIVPTAYAEYAIKLLESVGLLVNRSKSFTRGFFRESCGVDAFRGIDCTPVRLRTVWSSSRCPHAYESWISYANSFHRRQYYASYWYIADRLCQIYREIPEKRSLKDETLGLAIVPQHYRPKRKRWNPKLQRAEEYVWTVRPTRIVQDIDGWSKLLRWFTEARKAEPDPDRVFEECRSASKTDLFRDVRFDVRLYTERDSNKLLKRWR